MLREENELLREFEDSQTFDTLRKPKHQTI
jgi:hypothetical protein